MALTFFIWTYTPNYELIEQSEVEEVTIGEKKDIATIFKPYKMLYRFNHEWQGTVSATATDELMASLSQWKATNLRLVDTKIPVSKMNEMLREENCFTVFFTGNIPLPMFQSILPFDSRELPEITFNRMMVNWGNYQSNGLYVYFINTEKNYMYRANVQINNGLHFVETVVEPAKEYAIYKEIERHQALSLYVVDEPVETIKYTYYIDEIKPELFKNVLFADPKIVQRNIDNTESEKYTDSMSLMTVDTVGKTLNYVYPASESNTPILPSKLLLDSFDFINGHGGLTDDYRYVSLNEGTHQIEYLLFLQGAPVISYETMTRITTIWGDYRVFRYKRPYYSLEMDITSEKEIKALPSGQEIVHQMIQSGTIDMTQLSEIALGYYLSKAENQNLYTLEPSWFYVQNGSWVRITTEILGGVTSGLE